jgi:LysR family glycine cleavage system transcriptional activator
MRKHLPSLNQLRAFEATARHLSFSKAADELHVTHAAVSHQVKALEDFLETRLFDRLTRSIKLTDIAEKYYQDARQALDIIETSTAVFFQDRVSGVLKISVAPSFATRWLLPKLTDFQKQYENLKVQLEPAIEVTDFQKNDLDLAIRHGKGRWPGLKSTKLFEELLVPVAAPSLINSMSNEAFWLEPLVGASPRKHEWKNWVESFTRKPAPNLNIILYPTQALALDAAIEGGGIALADRRLIGNDVFENRLNILKDFSFPNKQGFYICYRKGSNVEAKIKVFYTWIIDQLQ